MGEMKPEVGSGGGLKDEQEDDDPRHGRVCRYQDTMSQLDSARLTANWLMRLTGCPRVLATSVVMAQNVACARERNRHRLDMHKMEDTSAMAEGWIECECNLCTDLERDVPS